MTKKGDFVVVDIETTGLSKNMHKITEIAAVKVKNGKVIDEFTTLVNPKCRIPSFITRLTGIDNEMVKDAPIIRDVLPAFLKFLGNATFVAHNATFDYNFIDHNSKRYLKKGITNQKLCTRKLANRFLTDLPSKKLSVLCEHFEITNEAAHRARGDAIATTTLLSRFVSLAKEREVDDLLEFQNSKINKMRQPK